MTSSYSEDDPWEQLQELQVHWQKYGGLAHNLARQHAIHVLMQSVLALHESVTGLTQLATYLVKDQKDLQIWMKENGLR